MLGIETLSGTARALATVGVVLGQAGVLYVGYGALSRAVAPAVREGIEGGD